MLTLELFAGAGSLGNVFKNWGCQVVSLDRDMDADIRTDIMDWDYRIYEPGCFDVIWSSPPCTERSRAKTTSVRKIAEASQVVQHTIGIMDFMRPAYWFLKNIKPEKRRQVR